MWASKLTGFAMVLVFAGCAASGGDLDERGNELAEGEEQEEELEEELDAGAVDEGSSLREKANEVTRSFECQVSSNNSGCRQQVSCPSGYVVSTAKAACNLEYGSVSTTQLDGTPNGSIRITKASDNVSDGSCFVGSTKASSGTRTISSSIRGLGSMDFGCREHDKNGGDCHVRGVVSCKRSTAPQPAGEGESCSQGQGCQSGLTCVASTLTCIRPISGACNDLTDSCCDFGSGDPSNRYGCYNNLKCTSPIGGGMCIR